MSIIQDGIDLAKRMQAEASALEENFARLKAEQVEIEKQLEAAKSAAGRLDSFLEASREERLCPNCFLRGNTKSPLVTMDGGTDTEDFFRCRKCGSEYSELVP